MPPPSKADLWSSGKDETVEVNQRALIDKILARYSGENTIFRELLQNADDAGAQHVQVKFYSQAGLDALDKGEGPSRLPDVRKDHMLRYVVTNDGIPFRTQDWQRLKKIAEGNPDEEKIGAFGVGFYSLWSVCDDPFVESGDKWMGFYWKDGKDQLLARSGDLPAESRPTASSMTGHPWTSFTMALREPTLLEGPLDLARFLITSLTFMRTIKKIDMLVDDVTVFEVSKGVKGKGKVAKSGLRTTSGAGMMSVMGVEATEMIITANVMKWLAATGFTPPPIAAPIPSLNPAKAFSFLSSSFFSRSSPAPPPTQPPTPPQPPEDPKEISTLAREIQVYQADIKVTVSPTFGKELERATKKPAPTRMPASLVFARAEDTTIESTKDVGGVFSGLCPPLDGEQSAKVFIGQATSQTTGIGGHLAARFIPTVERESIDLVDKHVSHWNKELLWVGGYLSRLIYELEMQELQGLWARTSVNELTARDALLKRGLHAQRFFTYKPTTPSAVVGQGMESAFYACGMDNKSLPVASAIGILPVRDVRMPSSILQRFLPELPTITPATTEQAPRFVARLRDQLLLRDPGLDDVVRLLAARPLTETEMVECLIWWQDLSTADGYNAQTRARLLDAAVLLQENGKIVPLSMIETFIKPQSSSIPTDMPLPHHTISYQITKSLKGNQLYGVFGWTELSILQYITYLVKPPMSDAPGADPETDLRSSPAFAEKVLSMLSRAWQSISANQQTAIALELKDVACVPTKAGFKKPNEAYFEKNLLFDDLPTIALPKNTAIKGGMEKMLLAIGVRKTVNLQLVFSRLIGGGTWTCQDLMKYLVSVKDTLTPDEVARLRQTAAFPLEVDSPAIEGQKPTAVRRKPNQLYEPTDAMRSLGLPLLDWGEGKWKSNSDEARMLSSLGLHRYPPIDVLLGIAASRAPMNEKALEYLLLNLTTHYINLDPSAFAGVAFLPATTSTGERTLVKPGEAFTNPACAILGFNVAHASIASANNAARLRVPTDPPSDRLINAMLSNTTTDLDKARKIFEYMATRVGHGGLERLQSAAFIPVKTEKDVRLVRPHEVYLASKDSADNPFKTVFTFVDFGSQANMFLRYCGVRSEPSVKDIASLLIKQPEQMLRQAGSPETYLGQLRMIAANWAVFDTMTRIAMKNSAFLLASQRVPVKRSSKNILGALGGSSPDDEYEREWVLAKPSEIAVIDDITMMQYFGRHVLAAPEEHLLETFYANLGARQLGTMVKREFIPHRPSAVASAQTLALRSHVLERLTIFLVEARRKHADVSPDFLAKEGNFVVQEVRELKAKFTYTNGKQQYHHLETPYATAFKGRNKVITLTISLSAQPDDYDIAQSLSGIVLKSPKADDALLLYSILSTPLMALKKRGFNVDRILNQQREERLRIQAETARDREKAATEKGVPIDAVSVMSDGTSSSGSPGKKRSLFERLRRPSSGQKEKPKKINGPGSAISTLPNSPSIGGGMPSMPGGFGGLSSMLSSSNRSTGGGTMASGSMGSGMDANGTAAGGGSAGARSTKRPTDPQDIRRTVQQAIDASRPEKGVRISDSRQAVANVSESQNNYCDESASADLTRVYDSRDNFHIWVPNGIADVSAFLGPKGHICKEFATQILHPIAEVFKLAPVVLSVFWDHQGPLIAFNRGGSIFCNARYFDAWHREDVGHGDMNDAFISWYFTIAHELAHNLESAHNASHEFYFSSIAEEYLVPFASLLYTTATHDDID